jgi:perosamine synthetase
MDIPLFRIYWDEDDVESVTSIIRRGSYWASGDSITHFESGVSEYLDVEHVVAFNSGGSALHAQMLAHGLKGGEVIVPAFTFIATAYAPLYVGARPVFADIEPETFCLDPEDVAEMINSKTRAIMPIHYGGIPGKTIRALVDLAEDHDLVLIEDAAESFGAKLGESFMGTLGNSGMFSLCQNKVFTTGEGGMVVTQEDGLAERLRLVRSYGRRAAQNYFSGSGSVDYVSLGYNWRMPEMLAALGVSQLRKVDRNISMRRKNASYLNDELGKISGIEVPKEPEGGFSVYQMYTIRVKAEARDGLVEHLSKAGVASKVYFEPLTNYSFFKGLGCERRLPVTECVSSQALTLPMFPQMSREELEYLAGSVRDFFEN